MYHQSKYILKLIMLRHKGLIQLTSEQVCQGQGHQYRDKYKRVEHAHGTDQKKVPLLSGTINLIQSVPDGHNSLGGSPESHQQRDDGKRRGSVGIDILDDTANIFPQILRKSFGDHLGHLNL